MAMTKISAAEIRKLATLSQLKLSGEEIERYQADLSAILSYVEILQDVDVSNLEPTSQVTGLTNVVRKDETLDYGVTADELLKNAPDILDHQFKVKRIIQ
jgi:aspartyl-tRNA(Asn)/glutamyl-tRNA(Gln) amidotransferase subunit C